MGITRFVRNWIRHDLTTRTNLKAIVQKQEHSDTLILQAGRQSRIELLKQHILHSSGSGVSTNRYGDDEIIVSLTSFGKRIYDTCLAIESIMQGTIRPNRIILWLSKEEFNYGTIPSTLRKQQERGLQIEFCKDTRSYKKLIPALQQYPKASIITIDDDALYEWDIVERMLNAHIEHPHAILACRMHRITLTPQGRPKSYLEWEHCISSTSASTLNFPTGCGGILYPANSLHQEVLNEGIFTSLCPNADDIWFYAMALMQGTQIMQVYTPNPIGYYYELPSQSIDPLGKINVDPTNCGNDTQLATVLDYYNLYDRLKA